jgi:hypothetical protein
MGAATYARWTSFWPSASGSFAAPMNEIPKVVFSKSLTSADWGETPITTGDVEPADSACVLARGPEAHPYPRSPPSNVANSRITSQGATDSIPANSRSRGGVR